ncbi:iron-containing alcohol dehydrogenase [Paenibacillus thalictri]|uniref:Iron-containing alcohol dehydrogenase n=1 Tax=Paenibacillus thalictri TaxID=2527873 RepID=A0A4Q9DLQ9_9BACL|nr:iron-containing alcohol dehydrogenase [Paenibacillus thalictri]TBL73368.1 iron-containing alcohol dehydrogenase [Paenibacillus thalictri]
MAEHIYHLYMPKAVTYGAGSFARVGLHARTFGKKALIVSDPVMERMGAVAECKLILQGQAVEYAQYLGVDKEPTDVHVAEALAVCRQEQCDVIVALGGGSCIDTAKAVAVLMTNEGPIGDYVNNKKTFAADPLPLIAVPTTAGTGSEVTKVTVIINTQTEVKMMISHPQLMPAVAVVDPMLTLSCPPPITAATGVDALCHAIEAYISRKAHPLTDLYALKAASLIAGNMLRAYRDGNDVEARSQMALGSMLAGTAFSNASVTLVHGMSRPVGALFHVPHGLSNAMLLPAVLEFTKDSALDRLAEVGSAIVPESSQMSKDELAEQVIRQIKRLCADLHIPNMKQWGIDPAKWGQAVSKMASDALDSGSPQNNPRIASHEEIIQLYHTCYDYELS